MKVIKKLVKYFNFYYKISGRIFRITVISGTFIYEFKYSANKNSYGKGILKSSTNSNQIIKVSLLGNLNNEVNNKFDYITLENKFSLEEIEYFLITSDYSKFMIKFQHSK